MESTTAVARSNNSSGSPPKEAATMVEPITEISDDTDPRNETFLTTVQEEDFEDAESEEEEEEPSIPLFHYSRIHGSLPRSSNTNGSLALSSRRTCSALGQIVLSSSSTSNRESDAAAAVNQFSNNTANAALDQHETNTSITDLWKDHAIPIAAHGFANGQIWLVDAVTGVAVADPTQLMVRTNSSRNQKAIVALSMDATGTFLAALDEGGMCTIFEMQFTVRSTTVTTTAAVDESEQPESSPEPEQQQQQHHNIFGFLSVLTGGKNQSNNDNNSSPRNSRNTSPQQSPQNAASSSPQQQPQQQQQVVPTLKLASLQIHRISYPDSFGTPTCLALDPAYKRKRALAVGFADGRLVLTKRGFVFQRRSDAVLYQGTADGIQALAWRHNLLAWADSSGVRLLDSETLQRIAHVDRPAGANPALYQHNLRLEAQPSLTFESNHRLLVAWGDCLLALKVTTQQQQQQQQDQQQQYKQRVECTMAWELDCIACGVSPLDAKHVLVVGVLPRENETDDDWIDSSSSTANDHHVVELQVIARSNGQVVFADELPLIQSPVDDTDGNNNNSNRQISTADYQLLSSFALSPVIETDGPFVMAPAKESTLQWSLDDVVVQDEQWLLSPPQESVLDKTNEDDNNDTDSVDSDDYAFVLRPLDGGTSTMTTMTTQAANRMAEPPIMVLACPGDAVLARTRNVDDAVSYALEQEKYALALHRALQHRQKLRRYDIADLVNEYLKALLRLNVTRVEKEHNNTSTTNRLSMRRMKLAAKALPRLLGGSREAWEHWITEFEKLPGALFVVHDSLPVRGNLMHAADAETVFQHVLTSFSPFLFCCRSKIGK